MCDGPLRLSAGVDTSSKYFYLTVAARHSIAGMGEMPDSPRFLARGSGVTDVT